MSIKNFLWFVSGAYLAFGFIFVCTIPGVHVVVGNDISPLYQRGDVITYTNVERGSDLSTGNVVVCTLGGWRREAVVREVKTASDTKVVVGLPHTEEQDVIIDPQKRHIIHGKVKNVVFSTLLTPMAFMIEYRHWITPLLAPV